MKEKNISAVYEAYFDMVYRICYLYFNGNRADSEDACQQVFLKYIEFGGEFDSAQHEKAWLIITAQNVCKSMLRRVYRKHLSLSEAENIAAEDKPDSIMEEIMKLPEKEKTAIYLHYYEGYSGAEIARLLKCRESTVFSYLHRGRKRLKKRLEEQL
ncbi:RNA polymerase sigma factor [Ruminococcus sp.]|uniref:RNA polymerase sigma factor n=1 Tax=Ruminococcus sp. TaxID=41978 RepID=UPI0025EFC649|nr:RNA polymerase sigma factor [Ruminococcus sp.]